MDKYDAISNWKENDIAMYAIVSDGMSEDQLNTLNRWMGFNGIHYFEPGAVQTKGYIKRFTGKSYYLDEELINISIEFILWRKLKEDYGKDFASFVKDKMSVGGQEKGE